MVYNDNKTDKEDYDRRRRKFLTYSSITAAGVVGAGILIGLSGETFEGKEKSKDTNTEYNDSRQFFKRKEDFDVISAATERIFPEEEMGPGAIELGVPYYIDRQLAGAWGVNANEYMSGPFFEGEVNQGYQTR